MARKKKNPEGRNDVTLATSLAGITPRRKPKAPVSKKEAMVQMADDELAADIMTKAIHSPLAQEGLDRLGVKNLTRLFKVKSTTYGSYYHKGHKRAKEFKKFGHLGDKKFHKKGKESITIATKDISSPSQFRTTATHEYGHASPDYETRQGTATREAILTRQDMRDPDPKEVAIAKKYFDKRWKGRGAKADKILDEAQAAAKKRLIKKGIYARPPKAGTNASPSKADNRTKTSSNKTLPPRKDRRDPSMGAVIASVADTMGHILTSPPRVLYTWAKEPTGKGFIKGIGKFNKIIRDSGKRAEKRFHASQTNYPKRKRTKSKTKAVNTRLGGG